MEDSYRDKGLRRQLMNELRQKGITDGAVPGRDGTYSAAFVCGFGLQGDGLPRHGLTHRRGPNHFAAVYRRFPDAVVADQKNGQGARSGYGSGYQAAVLGELGARIFTIERQKLLYDTAKFFLPKINPYYKIRFFFGDGYKGIPAYAPFDKVIVTCGAPYIPQDLVDQLKPGGRAVIPVGEGDVQKMVLLIKTESGEILTEEKGDFRFVPMLENKVS